MINYTLAIFVVVLVLWSVYDHWTQLTTLATMTTERDFLKNTILALYQKPIYVSLSVEQLETIANLVAEKMKEPKPWMN